MGGEGGGGGGLNIIPPPLPSPLPLSSPSQVRQTHKQQRGVSCSSRAGFSPTEAGQGYHEVKGWIILEPIEGRYNIVIGDLLSPRYTTPAESALEEYKRALKKRTESKGGNEGKMGKSSWLISFNMQGQTNTHSV